jgi:hypothetical protein
MRIGTLRDGMGFTYTGCLLLPGPSCVGIHRYLSSALLALLLCWVKSENTVTCIALVALWYTSEVYDNTGAVRPLAPCTMQTYLQIEPSCKVLRYRPVRLRTGF